MRNRIVAGCVCGAALFLAGCGGGAGDITGHVRYNGKPLSTGYVLFASQTKPDEVVSCVIQPDGAYRVTHCSLGLVKIAVKAEIPRDAHKELKERLIIPIRYASAEKSGLEYNVSAGRQLHDIDLAP